MIIAPGVYRETVTLGSSGGNSYVTGTVSVTNGSATVTGSGTTFTGNTFVNGVFQAHVLASGTDGVTNGTATFTSTAGNFQAGHVGMTIRIGTKGAYIISAVGSATSITLKNPDASAPSPSAGSSLTYNVGPESPYDILSVDSNTQITLAKPWSGPTLTGIAYECWRPISIIGDVSGSLTDGVGGVVRITGSDNDTTATRSNVVSLTTKNYVTLQGIQFDGCSSNVLGLASPIGLIVQDCTFTTSSTSGDTIAISGAAQANCTFRRLRVFLCGNGAFSISHSSTLDNVGHIIENCMLQPARGNNCIAFTRVGGTLVRNCTITNGSNAMVIVTALTVGQANTINNCLVSNVSTGLSAIAVSEIIEDFNNIALLATARTNTTTGANSTAVHLLPDMSILLAGYRFPWQFGALSQWSTLAAKAGMNPPADDFNGMDRPKTNSKCTWGAIQYNSWALETSTVRTGAGARKLLDAQTLQLRRVASTNVSTTISLYVRWETDYAGTKPQMIIRQPGQADTTVTATGSSGAWEQLTTTLTPAALPGYFMVLVKSLNTATSGSYSMYVDDLTIT